MKKDGFIVDNFTMVLDSIKKKEKKNADNRSKDNKPQTGSHRSEK